MTPLFADTSFYIATVGPGDVWHTRAEEISRTNRRPILTTEYVLTEVANFLSRVGDRYVFLQLYEAIVRDANTSLVGSSSALWQRGLELYRGRPDKDWSLTDCISFVVMQDAGLSEALTSDRHFEQAGFSVLLK